MAAGIDSRDACRNVGMGINDKEWEREMKERPILFSGPMVNAILNSRKTQTRRMKGLDEINQSPDKYASAWLWQPDDIWWDFHITGTDAITRVKCPYGKVGDHLWLRETWQHFCPLWNGAWCGHGTKEGIIRDHTIVYQSTNPTGELTFFNQVDKTDTDKHTTNVKKWRSPIHMPRWASRITLEITDVRVERLQDITGDDVVAEGIDTSGFVSPVGLKREGFELKSAIAYAEAWNRINGKQHPWADNPWVWVIEFKKI
jgi:hypothetical protein